MIADEIAEVAQFFFGTNDLTQMVYLNYVSCSPFRVPIARLAAAQAALEHEYGRKQTNLEVKQRAEGGSPFWREECPPFRLMSVCFSTLFVIKYQVQKGMSHERNLSGTYYREY